MWSPICPGRILSSRFYTLEEVLHNKLSRTTYNKFYPLYHNLSHTISRHYLHQADHDSAVAEPDERACDRSVAVYGAVLRAT